MDNEKLLYQFFIAQRKELLGEYDAFHILAILAATSVDDIFNIIREHKNELVPISTHNIPQFSKLTDVFRVLDILINVPEQSISREDLGYFLSGEYVKPGAKIKYAENHYKLAAQLGLVNDQLKLEINDLGMALFLIDSPQKQHELLRRLAFRVPIIQASIVKAGEGLLDLHALMRQYLSETTAIRRRSNVKSLIALIDETAGVELQRAISNIIWGNDENDAI